MAILVLITTFFIGITIATADEATSIEIRGTVANQTAINFGFNLSNASIAGAPDRPVWTPQSFPGFYYDIDDNLGQEQLSILSINDRTIPKDNLVYSTQADEKILGVVDKGFTDTGVSAAQNAANAGLEKFGAGDMAVDPGFFSVVGWQGDSYVGIKNKPYKLAKLLIDQSDAVSEKKSLAVGETWDDIGGGWTLTAQSIDAKATPRQVWLVLSKDGVKKDDKIIAQGQVYTYVEKNIGGETDVPLFVTYVDSVFAGATSDMVQLRFTWAVDTSITEIKGGDKFGIFEVITTSPIIQLNNTKNAITLNKASTVDLIGNIKFTVADSDDVRIYPTMEISTGTAPESGAPTANSTPQQTANVTVVATTSLPTVVQTITSAVVQTTTVQPVVQKTRAATNAKPLAMSAQKAPGFEAVFAIAGLLAAIYVSYSGRKP
ncbi:MAG: S-layer protein domain-containing protein [Candidatus Methanoperedens sp.]|nr:S-layer protein domain-containing protein [Candidatus Methanoperedens sp.]